ncbi:SDR family oxidoreductase [Vibrio sp. V39_P1S14PM300]|uniref:SDR family oxidoreductase n=1 Tax=Vibrio sp. V39_P1S14PM300 TaxID=1938690 RepID=UPI00137319B8|nr:SDR family oxidoreductase [Vibrio sp. V39_P1S14PM300]NAX23042.1 SDR family oxidoreductase [Vibrio sp. V39_P1S14PM300]
MDIKSAVILVTSAGSTLGATLATHFASLGAKVILCDKDIHRLHQTRDGCQRVSPDVHAFQLHDHTQASLDALFAFVEDCYGSGPDVLVNTLTTRPMPRLVSDFSPDTFTQRLALMASTLFTFGQATADHMRRANKRGVIVNVVAHEDYRDLSGFENAASMVTGFTQSWARELTPFNIRVGGVVPAITAQECDDELHWAEINDELIRNTEYIVANDYFSGRIMAA